MSHISVLTQETLKLLNLHEGSRVLDGTLGSGGHAVEIVKKIAGGKYIGLDLDQEAIDRSREKVTAVAEQVGVETHFVLRNFRELDKVLLEKGVQTVDAILLDLGWAIEQFEEGSRGFSYQKDEPLLMTLSQHSGDDHLTASEIVNTYSEEKLADLIYTYGEEQFSRRIAKGIAEERRTRRIVSTFDLVKVIEESVPSFYAKRRIHPATKTFQALRIAVNDELGALREVLEKGHEALEKGGRMAIITFHSLEDRIVKQAFRDWSHKGLGMVLTKKPIIAGSEEIATNRRARSAKLRGFEKAH